MVTEPPWIRQGSGVAARNGTATHTIPFGWTSTPGHELVAVLFGPVTHTAAGWTERLQPVNTGELSVLTKTSAGESSITVTHNGADYPVLWVVYEFPAGTTWVHGVSDVTFEDAFPELTGLPGRAVVVVAARGRVAVNTTATAASSVWPDPWTADADLFEPHNGLTDGAYLTVAHQINVTSATVIPSATSSYTGAFASDREHVVFAVEVPAASGVAGTLAGTLPAATGTLSGAVSASAALTATLPEATAQLAGSVTAAGTLAGTLPIPAVSLTGTLTTAGTLAGTLPALTGLLRQGRAVVPGPGAGRVARATALARGRAAAERLMADECVVRRQTGTVTDPDTGRVTPTYATVYAGKCRVQQRQAQARAVEAGEAALLMLRLEVHLPMSVTGIQVGDEVVIDASAHDPDLAGRVFVVRELAHKTHATARRLGVEERTS